MTCSLVDRLKNDTSNCRHYSHSDFRMSFGFLIATALLIIGGVLALDDSIKTWDAIPVTEHIVIAVVIDDGDSECVFVIEGKRVQTQLNPCPYVVDDVIELKTDGNYVRLIGAIYDD